MVQILQQLERDAVVDFAGVRETERVFDQLDAVQRVYLLVFGRVVQRGHDGHPVARVVQHAEQTYRAKQ